MLEQEPPQDYSYRSGHKPESLDQFERSFDVVEITEFWAVRSSKGNSMEFITVSIFFFTFFLFIVWIFKS
jgi:hypothetical protein